MSTATEHTDATPASGPRPRSPNFPRASAWDLLWWCKGPKEWAPAPLDADIERCLSVGPWLLAEKAVASVMVGGLWESDVLRDTPQTFIAEAAGVSLRVLARVLNVFEMAGVIVRLPKSAGSPRGELTAYRIDMERLRAWAGKPRPAEWGGPKRGKSGRPGASVAAVRDRTNEIQAAMRRAGASVDDPAWRQALKLAKRLDRIATRTARAEQAEARRLTAKREADDRRRAEHEKVSALLATSLAGIPPVPPENPDQLPVDPAPPATVAPTGDAGPATAPAAGPPSAAIEPSPLGAQRNTVSAALLETRPTNGSGRSAAEAPGGEHHRDTGDKPSRGASQPPVAQTIEEVAGHATEQEQQHLRTVMQGCDRKNGFCRAVASRVLQRAQRRAPLLTEREVQILATLPAQWEEDHRPLAKARSPARHPLRQTSGGKTYGFDPGRTQQRREGND